MCTHTKAYISLRGPVRSLNADSEGVAWGGVGGLMWTIHILADMGDSGGGWVMQRHWRKDETFTDKEAARIILQP